MSNHLKLGLAIIFQSILTVLIILLPFTILGSVINPLLRNLGIIGYGISSAALLIPMLLILITISLSGLQFFVVRKIFTGLFLTRKEAVIINIIVFLLFITYFASQAIPGITRWSYCREIVQSDYKRNFSSEAGQCLTFLENGRAGVIYFLFFGQFCLSTGVNLFAGLWKRKSDKRN